MNRRMTTNDIDMALRHIARTQFGLVTWRQAESAGLHRTSLDRRVRAGEWQRVHPGVFRVGVVPPTVEQRLLAAGLAVPDSTLIGPTAGLVDGLPLGARGAARPVVAVRAGRSARTEGITTVRLSIDLPTRMWHGVRVTTPAATLVTLPRFVSPDRLQRCLDHCLVERITTVPRVQDLVESLPYRAVPGRRLLLDMLAKRAERGIGHRSGDEQQVGTWLDTAGLKGWTANAQVSVGGGDPVECDVVWWAPMVILEVSPFHTHGSEAAQARDIERRRLLVAAGWRIIEAGDEDITDERSFQTVVELLRPLLGPRAA